MNIQTLFMMLCHKAAEEGIDPNTAKCVEVSVDKNAAVFVVDDKRHFVRLK